MNPPSVAPGAPRHRAVLEAGTRSVRELYKILVALVIVPTVYFALPAVPMYTVPFF